MRLVFVSIFLLAIFVSGSAFSQAQSTARATVKVVKGLQANAKTVNSLKIQKATSTSLKLGELIIRGAKSTACNIMIQTEPLKGENGGEATFTAVPDIDTESINTLDEHGCKRIKLSGSTGDELFSNNNTSYSGTYQVVFAYN